jgi:pSer/pThr/pTyr-binding forkhead associated (FHA) protein
MWTLNSIEPSDLSLTFRLLPGTLKTLGRAPRADFVVDTALVSRVHCRFLVNDVNELQLEDLGSTNGTFVNGQKVTKARLTNGDTLTVGRVQFVVNSAADSESDTTIGPA